MSKINLVGIELEGLFKVRPNFMGNWKHDSSVSVNGGNGECDGSCRDYCECYESCECDECLFCQGCDCILYDCCCDSCLMCEGCECCVDECQCYSHQAGCENKDCANGNIDACENCMEIVDSNRETYRSCYDGHGTYRSCDLTRCDCECECECEDCNNGGNVGEYVSYPLKVSQIDEWINKCYPDKTNSTCGGHIHVSLKSYADYMNLMDREFYEYYLKRMEMWGKKMKIKEGSSFWKRLKGANYCYAKFEPIAQRDMREHYEDPRYAQLNYCFNVDDRHTLEFRMLPCFQKSELMLSGIKETIDIVETFLLGVSDTNNMITLRIEV